MDMTADFVTESRWLNDKVKSPYKPDRIRPALLNNIVSWDTARLIRAKVPCEFLLHILKYVLLYDSKVQMTLCLQQDPHSTVDTGTAQ